MSKIKLFVIVWMVCFSGLVISKGTTPQWGYEGNDGADHWGDLDSSFSECKLGKQQSPIDIPTSEVEKANLPAIDFDYKTSAGEILNNGYTIQINLAKAGSVEVPSGEYQLLQFHFHTPSEEKINGKSFPLVAHLVHKNDEGKLAVVAILFEEGKENIALKNIFKKLPAKERKEKLKDDFDISKLLPANLAYYTFNGSLTTPPCSEGVAWHVLKTPVSISKSQINMFKKIFKMNARPVQPLNGRKIQEVG
jgi:carbonic anhydrase